MNKGCTDNVKLDCSSDSKRHAAWQRPRINPQHWNDKNKDYVSCHNQIDSLYICTQTEPAGQKPQGTATLKMWCWTKHPGSSRDSTKETRRQVEGKQAFALSMKASSILPSGIKSGDSKLHPTTEDLEITGRGGISY